MEMLSAIAPFFVAGLMGTIFARFTGMNMSMCVLLLFLYMGAKPVEAISAMLMFNVFTYFTVYSQLHVMRIKSFAFFPGVRLAIPILITVGVAALNPFVGIAFFILVFLLEIFAKIYREMNPKSRPSKWQIVQMVIPAGILVTIGAAAVQFIPENYYYIVGGVAILLYAAIMWRMGVRVRLGGTNGSTCRLCLPASAASMGRIGLRLCAAILNRSCLNASPSSSMGPC